MNWKTLMLKMIIYSTLVKAEADNLILKFIWKCKGSITAKAILKKKN